MKVLVTGGYFDQSGECVVWLVDLETERADVFLRWEPPEHLHVPTKGFAGSSFGDDGNLYVAAHAAVVRIDPHRAEVTGVMHQPCMNDLHHVAAFDDRLYVANTGLGAVDVLGLDGRFICSHAVLPAWVNTRRMGGEDFPTSVLQPGWSGAPPAQWPAIPEDDPYYSTDRHSKPFHLLKVRDYLHINHIAVVGDRILTTCFADGTVRDLYDFRVLVRLENHFIHDGVPHGDGFWLTAIDGWVIELDEGTLSERRRLCTFVTGHHGWCRGLVVTDDHLVVGLTEVRSNRLPKHRWAERDPAGSETSVLLLDKNDGRLLTRTNLTDKHRHSKLYSILPLGDLRA